MGIHVRNCPFHSALATCADPRSVYLGDTSTLAFLELVRHQVSNIASESDFVADGEKFNLVEHLVQIPPSAKTPCPFPDRDITLYLVKAFFTHVRTLCPRWMT
jgi:hypothetical protein